MNVLDVVKLRRSVRAFVGKRIGDEKIKALKEALIWAPSAGNLQSRKFYFVFDEDLRSKFEKAAGGQQFLREAPLVIVCCTDKKITRRYGDRGWELYAIQDVSASIENLLLVACDLGLATCWVGAFNEETIHSLLKLPETLRPISLIPVGYPAEEPELPKHLPESHIIETIA
ncbi:MAG: nitroreductase family protein [Candidatus Eisenbacteria bacterium]|nr:nitroreductase family protein [Candidatus Eisenbacteria bacterium]